MMRWSHEFTLVLADCLIHDDVIRLALGIYALYRVVNFLRFSKSPHDDVDLQKLLWLFAVRGAEGSKARKLLHAATILRTSAPLANSTRGYLYS